MFFRYPFSKSIPIHFLQKFIRYVCFLYLKFEERDRKGEACQRICRGAELRALCKTLRLWYGSQPEKRPE